MCASFSNRSFIMFIFLSLMRNHFRFRLIFTVLIASAIAATGSALSLTLTPTTKNLLTCFNRLRSMVNRAIGRYSKNAILYIVTYYYYVATSSA